jgi:hypothetical protein
VLLESGLVQDRRRDEPGVVAVEPNHDIAYERAALRWLARFLSEVPAVSLEEAQLALAALATMDRLEKDGTAQEALGALLRRHGLRPPKIVAA